MNLERLLSLLVAVAVLSIPAAAPASGTTNKSENVKLVKQFSYKGSTEVAASGDWVYTGELDGITQRGEKPEKGGMHIFDVSGATPKETAFLHCDPDFAIDTAGNVFVSEINLLNIAISKSEDSGKSYELQNFFAFTITDRQWKAADEKDVVYMVGNTFGGGTYPTDPVGNSGHILIKSKDGGQTFTEAIEDPAGLGDIHVDQRNGTLYETHLDGGKFEMWAFRGARDDKFKPEKNTIAEGVAMHSHWPAFDIDSQGNLYLVWDESGEGDRSHGVYYSYSTDEGRTWADPIRVDESDDSDLWPWLAVGARGKVAIAWLEASEKLPSNDPETPGDHGWRIVVAQSLNGLGCGGGREPGFQTAVGTPEPIHMGTICNGGTVCQAQGIDRRLGDYFSIEIDKTGALWAGYSDTREGGAVALPGYFRQTGGPRFGRNTSMP